MYTDINFKNKKELKEYIKNGGNVGVHQPNNMFNTPKPENGKCCVEGAWYPKPHTWYASVTLENGYIVKVS